MAPVFQTRDRVEADWGSVMAATVSSSNNKLDSVTERSERSEQWAWGSGRDCNGISELTQIKAYSIIVTEDWISHETFCLTAI